MNLKEIKRTFKRRIEVLKFMRATDWSYCARDIWGSATESEYRHDLEYLKASEFITTARKLSCSGDTSQPVMRMMTFVKLTDRGRRFIDGYVKAGEPEIVPIRAQKWLDNKDGSRGRKVYDTVLPGYVTPSGGFHLLNPVNTRANEYLRLSWKVPVPK